MIKNGADVNFVGKDGTTTFGHAVSMCMSMNSPATQNQRASALVLVKLMLEAGGDVETRSMFGTPLRQTLEMQGDAELIELLYSP